MKRQMHLGLFILGTGSHVAGWRYPGAMTSFQDFDQVQEIARIAERGRFDLIFMGDISMPIQARIPPTRCGSSR